MPVDHWDGLSVLEKCLIISCINYACQESVLLLHRDCDQSCFFCHIVNHLQVVLLLVRFLAVYVSALCKVYVRDLLQQFLMLPHRVREEKSNYLPHPVTVY